MLPVIFGCKGPALTEDEATLFRQAPPFGLILFARNCKAPGQIRALVHHFRTLVGRADAPIMIDQEGGRVQRLRPPYWAQDPAASVFADLHQADPAAALRAIRCLGSAMGDDLRALGITINATPCLDLRRPETTTAIGDRSHGPDAEIIVPLARALMGGLRQRGILPVIKHMPGHGRAKVDSHYEMPRINAGYDQLAEDRAPFAAFTMGDDAAPIGMTGHLLVPAYDPDLPATLSPKVISEVIRGAIGFRGLLLTDDLCMQALALPPAERATAALAAGCDIAVHCNGNVDEMRAVTAELPEIRPDTLQRWSAAKAWLSRESVATDPYDGNPAAARIEMRSLLASALPQ